MTYAPKKKDRPHIQGRIDMTAPDNLWHEIDRKGRIKGCTDAHLEPCAGVLDAFTAYTRTATIPALLAEARAEGKAEGLRESADFVGEEAGSFPDSVAWCVEDLAKAILTRIDTPAPAQPSMQEVADRIETHERNLNNGFPMTSAIGRDMQEAVVALRALAGEAKP